MKDWSKVKRVCDKATGGWWLDTSNDGIVITNNGLGTIAHVLRTNDVVFIALARTALPEAITEIEQLRQDKAELESQVDALSTTVNMYVTPYYTMKQEKAELVEISNKALSRIEAELRVAGLLPPQLGYECHGYNELERLRERIAKLEGGEPE